MDKLTFDLFEAAKSGSVEDAALALAFGANINGRNAIGFTPLMYACWRRNAPVVDLLLRVPTLDASICSPDGLTALHFAASAVSPPQEAATLTIITSLIRSRKVDLNARSAGLRETALMRSIAGHMPSVASALIWAPGSDLSATDAAGRTALDWATHFEEPNIAAELMKAMKEVRACIGFNGTL